MNMPISGTRGFFEILMPGIFLTLNAAVTMYVMAATLVPELMPAVRASALYFTNPALAAALLVVVGYPVGVVLRLLKNARIDARSAKYIGLLHPKQRDASYLKGEFFYGRWMKQKTETRLPAGAAGFYEEYWEDKDTGDGRMNTTFFNFCKTVVAKNDPQSCSEIYGAEALIRFLAGSYYALQAAVLLMVANAFCAVVRLSPRAAIFPLLFAAAYLYLLHVILSQYRFLRCKEVDTVFNACFANREHFDHLFPTIASRSLAKSAK